MSEATVLPRSAVVRRWGVVLIGLGVAYFPSWGPHALGAFGLDLGMGIEGPAASIVWNATAVGFLLAYILLVERRQLDSIRIVRPTSKDMEWALILFGCHMGWAWLAPILWPPPAMDSGTREIAAMSIPAVVALILSAAVFEEILHRGYPIQRLTELTHHSWIAVAVTLPLFVLPHVVFFGPQWLLYQGSGTAVLYILFLWRRNLVACMVLHLCMNLPILIPTIASRVS